MKAGLTLSGGGAKGAYEAGAVKALAEMGIQINAISGASIGALNAAVVAAAPSVTVGAQRLCELWQMLAADKVLRVNSSRYLELLVGLAVSAGAVPGGGALLTALAGTSVFRMPGRRCGETEEHPADDGLLTNSPLVRKLKEWIPSKDLQNGIPLYVSLYKSRGLLDALQFSIAASGVHDTPDSHYLHVQSLGESDQQKALLASAAIPGFFAAQEIAGEKYVDGGIGGWMTASGNTPVTPLVDAGCDMIFIVFLQDGSLWSRDRFPHTTCIEIRPLSGIARDGKLRDLFAFTPARIPEWIEMGYNDTRRSVEKILDGLKAGHELATAHDKLDEELNAGKSAQLNMQTAMNKLNTY